MAYGHYWIIWGNKKGRPQKGRVLLPVHGHFYSSSNCSSIQTSTTILPQRPERLNFLPPFWWGLPTSESLPHCRITLYFYTLLSEFRVTIDCYTNIRPSGNAWNRESSPICFVVNIVITLNFSFLRLFSWPWDWPVCPVNRLLVETLKEHSRPA